MIEEVENGQQYGKITDKGTLRETPRYQITLNLKRIESSIKSPKPNT